MRKERNMKSNINQPDLQFNSPDKIFGMENFETND